MIKRIVEFLTRYSIGKNESVRRFPQDQPLAGDVLVSNGRDGAEWKQPKSNKKAKIKVAIDESIGAALAKKIEVRGYQIVCRAGHAETDESWMKRALASGALFIISPDLDIPSMIERENLPMVWIDFLFAGYVNPKLSAEMPKEQKHAIWSQYLHDRIQSKLRFLNKEFGDI